MFGKNYLEKKAFADALSKGETRRKEKSWKFAIFADFCIIPAR